MQQRKLKAYLASLPRAERRRYLRGMQQVHFSTKDGPKVFTKKQLEDAWNEHNEVMRGRARQDKMYEEAKKRRKQERVDAFEVVG